MDELHILFPEPQRLTIGGEPVDVSPLKIGEIPRVAKALRGAAIPLNEGDVDLLAVLAGDSADAVLDAVAIAVRKPRAWLDALPADAALNLAFTVMEVNADFFAARVLPALTAGMERTTARLGGLMPSSTSSPMDTA